MVPPVPIPNTVVKHSQADGTWLETTWESRRLLVRTLERVSFLFYFYFSFSCVIKLQNNFHCYGIIYT